MSEPGAAPAVDHANVAVMPPLLYLGAVLIGVAVHWFVPLAFPVAAPLRWALGGALVVAGSVGAFGFARAFQGIGQDRSPNTPTPSIVTGGLYRFSRNPAYVSLTAIQIGIALLLDNGWILLAVLPVLAVMQRSVILREEAYLERKFGDEYLSYKAEVRRWL